VRSRSLTVAVLCGAVLTRNHRVERRRAQFRSIGFRCIGPFGLRGKEPPDRADVSFSPSKIPYGGFSPVRLQTGFPDHDLHAPKAGELIRGPAPSTVPLWPLRARKRGHESGRSSPEALGSPTGCVVRPDPALLWPHLRLSGIPADLCIRRRAFAADCQGPGEGPQFTLLIYPLRAAFRTPADRATASDCCFIALTGLRHSRTGSASSPGLHRFLPRFLTRLQSSLYATARKACSPFTDKGFYVRAFTSQVTSKRCRI